MEIDFKGNKISFKKELTIYDNLALTFSKILQHHHVKHAYVSGYIAILFGRSRTSEDIDILVERIPRDRFVTLWDTLSERFYCHNTKEAEVAYNDYLEEKLAIRFSLKDIVIPNVEFKWASTEQQKRAVAEYLNVILSGKAMPISSLEMQIAYKLYLGSDKDVEDARYLFELFRERLNLNKLKKEVAYLKIPEKSAKAAVGW